MHDAAAIILAGGERSRLRSLTRRLVGDDRPKQAAHVADPARTFIVVTCSHERCYRAVLADAPPGTGRGAAGRPRHRTRHPVAARARLAGETVTA